MGATPVRRRGLRSLAGLAPRLLRWQPLAGAVVIVVVVLIWPTEGWKGGVWSLRAIALALAMGALFFLDDAAAELIAPVPTPLWVRTWTRAGAALLATLPVWIVALLVEGGRLPGVWVLWLSMEFAALLAAGLALTALLGRGRGGPEPGVLAMPGMVLIALAMLAVPEDWNLLSLKTTDWASAHVGWAAVLSAGVTALLWAVRDPGRSGWRSRAARPSSSATRP